MNAKIKQGACWLCGSPYLHIANAWPLYLTLGQIPKMKSLWRISISSASFWIQRIPTNNLADWRLFIQSCGWTAQDMQGEALMAGSDVKSSFTLLQVHSLEFEYLSCPGWFHFHKAVSVICSGAHKTFLVRAIIIGVDLTNKKQTKKTFHIAMVHPNYQDALHLQTQLYRGSPTLACLVSHLPRHMTQLTSWEASSSRPLPG